MDGSGMRDGGSGETTIPQSLVLAQALCTRLCHDLGGPIGALAGALELIEGASDDAAEVACDAARILDRRLRFWRVAVGGASGPLDPAEIAQLAEGLTLGRRAQVDLEGLDRGCAVAPEILQPLLLAMLVGVEAMPRGGTLRVAGSPERELSVWPDGPSAAWPPGLAALVAGKVPVPTPRTVVLPLLAATAGAARLRLDLPMGGPGPGPLLLTSLAGG